MTTFPATPEPNAIVGLVGILAALAGSDTFTLWTCPACGKDLDSHCAFCGRPRPGRPCAPGAPECECAPLVPYDLTADCKVRVKVTGSSDPDSLDYGGPLNLLGLGAASHRPCSLHPSHVIGEDGCPRCWEILEHRKTLRDA